MGRRLPPLNAVKAFEASGRLGSMSTAAAELGVTHGAISRQVAILEDWLGARLFAKDGRGLALTTEGQLLLSEATKVLDGLARVGESLAGQGKPSLLRVNAPQTFTMRWLIPRLSAFSVLHPNIEIRLSASIAPISTIDEPFDIAIRRGSMGTASTSFLAETCVPVASPILLSHRPVREIGDLGSHTLLHAESVANLWPDWLRRAGRPDLHSRAQLRFEPLYHSLQAAVDGAGIAMGPSALVADDLATGRLVALFRNLPLAMNDFHLLVMRGQDIGRRRQAFRAWIEREGSRPARPGNLVPDR